MLMGTAGLSAGAVVALLLTILRKPVDGDLAGRERTARLFLIGLAAQCLHFMEEFVTTISRPVSRAAGPPRMGPRTSSWFSI